MVDEPHRSQPAAVVVDELTCERLASWLTTRYIPEDREDSTLPALAPIQVGNFYLALVAICHQTSPRGHLPLEGTVNGRYRRGWDYLLARFEAAATADPHLLAPEQWASLTVSDVANIFWDPRAGHRLTDPGGRAALLNDLGERMLRFGWLHADNLRDAAQSRVGGQGGLLELLSGFRAYDDPVRKKSLFFLSLMQNHGLWKFVDPENLGPPVDYHEVRGHLRIGTVRVLDPDLRARLYRGGEVSQVEDVAIRSSVYQAIMLLSRRSGLGPSRLHYLFWNVFRSVCTRDNPDCLRLRPETTLPERYLPLTVHADGPPRCPFSGTCASCGSAELLLEHVFLTDWY